MKLSLEGADLVILAESHNPSIVSPEWLKQFHLIEEPQQQFVHTRDFSLFESGTYSLIVDQQRMQISIKAPTREKLAPLAEIGCNYLRLLPHIPYQAAGFNILFRRTTEQGEALPQIHVSIGATEDMSGIIAGHELKFGCIINAKKTPYVLRLIIEPQGENTLSYNFNYHHNLIGCTIDQAIGYITNISSLYDNSEEIAQGLA